MKPVHKLIFMLLLFPVLVQAGWTEGVWPAEDKDSRKTHIGTVSYCYSTTNLYEEDKMITLTNPTYKIVWMVDCYNALRERIYAANGWRPCTGYLYPGGPTFWWPEPFTEPLDAYRNEHNNAQFIKNSISEIFEVFAQSDTQYGTRANLDEVFYSAGGYSTPISFCGLTVNVTNYYDADPSYTTNTFLMAMATGIDGWFTNTPWRAINETGEWDNIKKALSILRWTCPDLSAYTTGCPWPISPTYTNKCVLQSGYKRDSSFSSTTTRDYSFWYEYAVGYPSFGIEPREGNDDTNYTSSCTYSTNTSVDEECISPFGYFSWVYKKDDGKENYTYNAVSSATGPSDAPPLGFSCYPSTISRIDTYNSSASATWETFNKKVVTDSKIMLTNITPKSVSFSVALYLKYFYTVANVYEKSTSDSDGFGSLYDGCDGEGLVSFYGTGSTFCAISLEENTEKRYYSLDSRNSIDDYLEISIPFKDLPVGYNYESVGNLSAVYNDSTSSLNECGAYSGETHWTESAHTESRVGKMTMKNPSTTGFNHIFVYEWDFDYE